ncbi:MAG TPA: BTAD domain-containing putative transcriptional regulator [Pseudonocardiaceae bacterium]
MSAAMPAPESVVEPIRFSVLGPVRVWRGPDEVVGGPPQQRAILALLLVRAGGPVSMAELTGLLWPTDPPPSAANVVHRYIGMLRRQLEPGLPTRVAGRWLVRQVGSYRLNVDAESLDVLRFRELVHVARGHAARGQSEETVAGAVDEFVTALALWRGPCLAGVEASAHAQAAFAEVDRERVVVALEAADAALSVGRSRKVLAAVREVAALHPLDEPLQTRLMLTLAASGYQADALATFREVSARLAEELGIDPGAELRAAHQRVLRQQVGQPTAASIAVAMPPTEAQATPPSRTSPVILPAQLPPDLPMFTGRRTELDRLNALLDPERAAPAMPICVVDGIAGIGKTSFAVHWAHQLAGRYPDGQLYVDLRGFDPSGAVLGASKALRGFLDALGVGPQRVPDSMEAQAGLYRSLLNGRRVLILLDNARDVAQVRPLLPAAAGCLVIITSRNQLSGLITTHAARTLTLDPFSVDEAREVLTRRLGVKRLADEVTALDEIIAGCAGLPLATAIVAARATIHPNMPLAAIADELRDERTRLDAFSADGDVAADVRAVFSWSYRQLSQSAGRLFRLLSVGAGPDISRNAAASLLGVGRREVRHLLTELTSARLLIEHYPGRYSLHDLVRVYASELSESLDGEDERREALGRLLDHYLITAHHAQLKLWPLYIPAEPPPARPGVTPEDCADRASALDWFTEHRQVLTSAIRSAATGELASYAWELALRQQQFFQLSARYHDWAGTMRVALQAAREQGDLPAQARMHRSLAGAYHFLRRDEPAIEHLTSTCALFHQLGYRLEHGYVCANFGAIRRELGQVDAAMQHYKDALELFREMDNAKGKATALEGISWCETQYGNICVAVGLIEQGMQLYRQVGDTNGVGYCWSALGKLRQSLGEHESAIECFSAAFEQLANAGDRADTAECLLWRGDSRLALGEVESAREDWQRALTIMEDLQLPLADTVRTRLSPVAQ